MKDERPDTTDLAGQLGDLQDLFGTLFGSLAGRDRTVPLVLTPVEAAAGCEKTIVYERVVPCPRCVDEGPCGACEGKGQVSFQQGDLVVTKPCAACGGLGRDLLKCGECTGQGERREESLTVSVPAGVAEGTQLRILGKGDERVGQPAGALYVAIAIGGPKADDVEPGAHPFRDARARGAKPAPAPPPTAPWVPWIVLAVLSALVAAIMSIR